MGDGAVSSTIVTVSILLTWADRRPPGEARQNAYDPRRDASPLGEYHGLARESLLPVRGEQKHVEHANQL